jgi:Protein of unknown function (DUF3891)
MMVQTAPQGEPSFVINMREHLDFCGQLVRAYGNDRFERPEPYDEMLYVVDNHDRGWDDYDVNPGIDPNTKLPYLMSRTPAVASVKTNRGSPDFNEAHHPYCGLLSSMHTWGLYNKRYGFTQFVVRPARNTVSINVADPNRPMVDKMLADEVARQERLKQDLAKNPATQSWLEQNRLFQNYKQLTFFDTLALYFHLYHASERGEEVYIHVPMTAESDANIMVKKIDDRTYSLDPFPFAGDTLKLTCRGRYAQPFADDFPADKVGAALAAMPKDMQTYQLVPVR